MSSDGSAGEPSVSVLIAVHNGRPYVESAVRSIMEQTLREIEIVVVDDASTDDTPEVLCRLAAEDGRIRIERLSRNLGPAGAANHGLDLVRAPLVARMDADDLSYPSRLAVQKRYMDLHPEVVALGTSLRYVGPDGAPRHTAVRPRDPVMCRWVMRWRPPVGHPTMMMRRHLPDGSATLYDASYRIALDYDILERLSWQGEIACLPDVLLDYRQHAASITGTKLSVQKDVGRAVSLRFLERDLPADVAAALVVPRRAFFDQARCDPAEVFEGLRRLLRHDLDQHPSHAAWLWRQTAQLAHETLRRSGHSRAEVAAAFLRSGRDLLPSLVARFGEASSVLPRGLSTQPDLWKAPRVGQA